MIVQWPDELQEWAPDYEPYMEYGTGHSHWTDNDAQEEVERNPIGFVWQSS